MLIAHSFNAGDYLDFGCENILTVHILSSIVTEGSLDTDLNVLSNGWFESGIGASVKAQHSFGWDIMPRNQRRNMESSIVK